MVGTLHMSPLRGLDVLISPFAINMTSLRDYCPHNIILRTPHFILLRPRVVRQSYCTLKAELMDDALHCQARPITSPVGASCL
jgi:hypothetical protein